MHMFIGGSLLVLFSYQALGALAKFPIKDFSWRTSEISVCFEKPHFDPQNLLTRNPWSYYKYRAEIEQWTTKEFKRAGLLLKNWSECEDEDKTSLHLNVMVDTLGGPFAHFLGKKAQGVFAGVNIDYTTDQGDGWYPRTIATHEILHTLGFHHEQERPDATTCSDLQGLKGEYAPEFLALGDYDPRSVMNYCSYDLHPMPEDFNQTMAIDQQMGQLTETDVAALRAYLFEPVAEINNPLRATTNLSAHEFLISGIKVKSYAYQFGLADTLDCQNLKHYSPQRSIDQPLKVSFSEPGRYKICLLGSDGTQTQSPKAYTSYVWTKTQSSLSIDSNITLLPHHSSAPLVVRSLQDKVWVKIVQTKDKDTCSQGEGYRELPTQNLRVSPGDWIQDWSNDFEAVICVSESMTDFTDVAFEHIILLFDGIDFIGLSSGISEGDVVKAIPNNFDHFFTHFRYALVSEAALCRDPGTQYSEIRVVGQPVIFYYDSVKTKFICGMALDRFGHWTKLEHAFAQDLLKPVD